MSRQLIVVLVAVTFLIMFGVMFGDIGVDRLGRRPKTKGAPRVSGHWRTQRCR